MIVKIIINSMFHPNHLDSTIHYFLLFREIKVSKVLIPSLGIHSFFFLGLGDFLEIQLPFSVMVKQVLSLLLVYALLEVCLEI
jgi:hypothetical protein